ncbi:hypothetical protein E2C01_079046 [Portunus trituberculatus]|uniref:Uncharacterized protein n=1 Tax=Portunus trituberculatus TaxID=210409 RepID=A0A5B7IQE1_PORTR|nr:hypothetical protein [Portunus trituberculatus]
MEDTGLMHGDKLERGNTGTNLGLLLKDKEEMEESLKEEEEEQETKEGEPR